MTFARRWRWRCWRCSSRESCFCFFFLRPVHAQSTMGNLTLLATYMAALPGWLPCPGVVMPQAGLAMIESASGHLHGRPGRGTRTRQVDRRPCDGGTCGRGSPGDPVEADVTDTLRPERGSAVHRHLAALEEDLRRVAVQPEAAAVQPGQERALRRAVPDGRQVLGEQLAEQQPVSIQVGQHLLEPSAVVHVRVVAATSPRFAVPIEAKKPISRQRDSSAALLVMSCAHLRPGTFHAFDAEIAVTVWSAAAPRQSRTARDDDRRT